MEWQPISTAPTNGTPVLLFLAPPLNTGDAVGYAVPGELSIVVGWSADNWRGGVVWQCGFCEEGTADTNGYSSALMMGVRPSHWMALPPPPSA